MTHRIENGVLHIKLSGDILSTGIPQIRQQMNAILETPEVATQPWTLMNLDLGRARLIDSMGLNFLVGLLKVIHGRGAAMRITICDNNLDRLLRFTRLHEHAEVVREGTKDRPVAGER
jgi:anti-anti-sigma factor